jgi:mono/diheme cytochrome c family protein
MKRLILPYLFLGLGLSFGPAVVNAQDAPKKAIKTVDVKPTQTLDAKAMFHEYCAVCHGEQGTGNGPAADALKKAPADLTQIARKNGGAFPKIKVARVIDGSDVVAAHGSRAMPVWGNIFRSMEGSASETLRVNALMAYIEGLQAR